MNKNKLKIIISTISAALSALLLFSTSFAWFYQSDIIDANDPEHGISGSVLTNYFHTGTGTEEDPFVITRPVHWENLVWLHNNIEDFYNAKGEEFDPQVGKGYFFQIGYDLDDDGRLEVYDYTDEGYLIDDSYSESELNLTCFSQAGKELIPIGSPQYPFIGDMNGNNFKLSGFKVTSYDKYHETPLEDVGIFGYVGPTANVHDLYFSDYVVDASDAQLNDATSYDYHTDHIGNEEFPYPCVGSLAGHIMISDSFKNVYVNNCKIESKSGNTNAQLNSYSYYGVVEVPGEGGHVGPGNNYSFTFDSSAVYRYMNQNYNTIFNNPMRARNTEYADTLVHDPEFNGDDSTKTPFENGMRYITSGLNSYNLIGDDPDDYSTRNPYTGYNYSLSTLGYQPLTADSKTFTYKAVTEDGHQTPSMIASIASKSYADTMADNNAFNGYNIAWDPTMGNWSYYHIETEPVDPRTVSINVKLTEPVRVTSNDVLTNQPTNSKIQVSATLYIDDEAYEIGSDEFSYSFSYESTDWLVVRRYHNPYLEISNFNKKLENLTLGIGTHHVALVFHGHTTSGIGSITQFREMVIAYAGSITSDSRNDQISVTPKAFELDQHAVDGQTFDWEFNQKSMTTQIYTSSFPGTHVAEQEFGESDKKPFIKSDGWNKKLVGYDEISGNYYDLNNDGFKITKDLGIEEKLLRLKHDEDGNVVFDEETGFPIGIIEEYDEESGETTYTEYVPKNESEIVYDNPESEDKQPINILISTQVRDPAWIATREAPKVLATHDIVDADSDGICDVCEQPYNAGETSHNDAPVFIGDSDILTESGYNSDNIDIVGGGFQFSQTFVTIDGEDNRALTTPLTSADIGKKWYATEHGPNSIILYLSNNGGINASDVMGDIEFDYTWNISLAGLKSMAFKKGGRNGYVYIDQSLYNNVSYSEEGDYSETGNTNKVVKMKLRRGIVKKCAYAALDKEGNILCGYDTNGNQIANSGTVYENQIKTYVLMLGVKNTITLPLTPINTRITKIIFNYAAPSGFGGSFGSVEYRDITQTVEFTILNFYYLVAQGDKYSVFVKYTAPASADGKGRYDVTFEFESGSADITSLDVNFYLYDIDNYEVYCNGVRVAEQGNGIATIPSTTISDE